VVVLVVVVGDIGGDDVDVGDSRTIDSKWVASTAAAAKNPRERQLLDTSML
jgi:hypothetical protein